MNYLHAFAISAAGMSVERTRVDVSALNLANANTVQSADGNGYRPLRATVLAGATPGFSALVGDRLDADKIGMLPSVAVLPADVNPRLAYEPGHPMANERGFVAYPGVDTATEMVTLMSAMRSYEANVAAMNTARNLALKTLDIGGGNT
ncbi:flagellar basal body rod protein FlgC [Variovorax terrae]|uniref:Flagellar basal-body rod protein FlgC n=1 Tax=Variovorax terrae TaxID=2923278 RepID=A0A9X1VWI7_9BURK|nr:flagellar basal body rod protein FlgC [Variovorax terrae]MCJ0764545.1 flagellar basal body rod protein FlgC [Variovorax terrae]